MPTNLRLHQDDVEPGVREGGPEAIRFPGTFQAGDTPSHHNNGQATLARPALKRLVGATVLGDPRKDAAPHQTAPHWSMDELLQFSAGAGTSVIKFPAKSGGGKQARPDDHHTTTPDLVEQIEKTLERMQRRLDQFSRELDDSYPFPPTQAPSEASWHPPAA